MKPNKLLVIFSIICIVSLMLTVFVGCNNDSDVKVGEKAEVYVTTGTMSKLLSQESSLTFSDYTEDDEFEGVTVTVDATQKLQEFYGYGACLTHSSAYLLTQDGAESIADEMLEEMFGTNGARFGIVRIPIGSSDYIEGSSFFTCDDLPGRNDTDASLEHFTIEKDANIISVLKKIIAINPDVKIFACPWSAPAWMKTNKSLLGGTLNSLFYDVYADYLIKFVEAYKAEGIEIDYVSLVNEPLITNISYPHMMIDELQAIEIGKAFVKSANAKSLNVSLLGWDHNVDEMAYDYLDTVFSEDAEGIFKGFALHGYADVEQFTVAEGADYIHSNYPDVEIFMTEVTEHSGSNDFASNLSWASRYITVDPLNYGLNGAMFWNLVLRSDGSPTPIKHNNECYGVMDLDYADGEYYYYKRSGYYALAHVGKFAYKTNGQYPQVLKTESSNDSQIMATALYRADGAIIVTAVNISDQLSETVHFNINGKKVSYEIQPQSVVTIVCDSEDVKSDGYTSYDISNVNIQQKGSNEYDYLIESNIAPSSNAKVYITRYDSISANDKPIDYSVVDGKYSFNATVPYSSYYIYVVDGDKTAVLPMYRPQMAPTLTDGDGNMILTYNFVNGTSWSSFCDPTGKSVYKSTKSTFDESAQLVAKNVNIFGVDTTTDYNPSEDAPYYYVVLSAKNGIVTYVSAPIMTIDNSYSDIKVELELIDNVPTLIVSGKFVNDGNVTVEIYSADTKLGKVVELLGESASGKAGESFSVKFDASKVVNGKTGAGIWYDIKLATTTGNLFEISDSAAELGQNIKAGSVTYEFKEYKHILKLNYEMHDYDVQKVEIKEVDGKLTLVVDGTYDESLKDIKLHADYEIDGTKYNLYWDNLSAESGKFEFNVILSELPTESTPWCWFHIYTYQGNATVASTTSELPRGNALSIGQKFNESGVEYVIQAYNGTGSQLVIQANPKEDEISVTVVTKDVDGKSIPTLVVTGSIPKGVSDIKLHGHSDKDGYVRLDKCWDNISTENGKFKFEVYLTTLPRGNHDWTWFHIYTYTEGSTEPKSEDLNRGSVLKVGDTYTYESFVYTVKAWTDGTQVGEGLAIEGYILENEND